MKVRLFLTIVGAALLLGVIVLVVVGNQGDSSKTIRLAISQEPDTLNPILSNMLASQDLVRLLFVPLFDRVDTEDGWREIPVACKRIPTFENGLVTKVEGVENDPPPTRKEGEKDEDFSARLKEYNNRLALIDADGDGKHTEIVVKWELREEMKWSDGVPVTADDYIYAREFILSDDPAFPVPSRDAEQRIKEMRSENNGHTLVVHWKEPYANYVQNGHQILPKHVVEPLVKSEGANFEQHEWNRNPTSCGPWVLDKWQSGQRLVFKRNPQWWGKTPKAERLMFNVIAETQTISQHLRNPNREEGVDATAQVGLNFDDGTNFVDEGAEGFDVYFTPGLVWEHIDVNLDDPILKDVRVRQALLFGMDREHISQSLFKGKQPVAHSWVPPLHPGFNPKAPHYDFAPDKAIALLEAAGWTLRDGETTRRNAAGDVLRLKLSTTAGNRVRQQVSEVIQQQWAAIGVQMDIDLVQADTFFSPSGPLTRGKFQLGMYAWIFTAVADGTQWTSQQIPTEANGWQGQNNPRLRNEELDRIDNLIPITLDPAERINLFHREQEVWCSLLPALPLYYRTDVTITRAGFVGWKPTRGGSYACWNSEEWALSKEAAGGAAPADNSSSSVPSDSSQPAAR